MSYRDLDKLLRTFSVREWKKLGDFLQFSAQASSLQLLSIWQYLDAHWPVIDLSPPCRKALGQALFPSQSQANRKLRERLKAFQQIALDFLAIQEFQSDNYAITQWHLKALARRGLSEMLHPLHLQLEQQLNQESQRDAQYYQKAIYLQQEWFDYPPGDTSDAHSEQVSVLIERIDAYHMLTKLWYCCELHMRRTILKEDYPIPSHLEIEQMIQRKGEKPSALLDYYLQVLHCHQRGGPTQLELIQLISQFKKLQVLLSVPQRKNVFRHLVNWAYQKMNQKDGISYTQIIFDLYHYGNEQQLLLQGGRMTDLTFNNITVTGCLLKKFDWVEKFISEYQQFLAPKIRSNATTLSKTYLYFHQKKFGLAVAELQEVRFINPAYMLRGRALSMRSLYEGLKQSTKGYSSLISHIKSFKRLLYRYRKDVISEEKLKMYLGMSNIIKRLADHRIKGLSSEKHRSQTLKLMDQLQPIIAPLWLKEKIEEWYD